MSNIYKEIEEKWQQKWYQSNLYKAKDLDPSREKMYILTEFPFPSGASLHVGHCYRYTVPDIYARFARMNGKNVLFPIGWDAFGLPTEEFARKTGANPKDVTKQNIQNLKDNLIKMGYGIDWEREFSTTDEDYYKWTQWIFGQFYRTGLASQAEIELWWCPNLSTVLANEEVLDDENGNKVSERGGHPKYAEQLLSGLEETEFPEFIKNMQKNWIGKSEGAIVNWEVVE
jgi:leucyl-tRNA synthetase